jgi:hypothetical protein
MDHQMAENMRTVINVNDHHLHHHHQEANNPKMELLHHHRTEINLLLLNVKSVNKNHHAAVPDLHQNKDQDALLLVVNHGCHLDQAAVQNPLLGHHLATVLLHHLPLRKAPNNHPLVPRALNSHLHEMAQGHHQPDALLHHLHVPNVIPALLQLKTVHHLHHRPLAAHHHHTSNHFRNT